MELKKTIFIVFLVTTLMMIFVNVIAEWKANLFFSNVVHKFSSGFNSEDSYIFIRDLRISANDVYAKIGGKSTEKNESKIETNAVKETEISAVYNASTFSDQEESLAEDEDEEDDDDYSFEGSADNSTVADERMQVLNKRAVADNTSVVQFEFSLNDNAYPKVIERIPTPSADARRSSLQTFGVKPAQLQKLIRTGIQNSHPFGYTITSDVCKGRDILMLIYVHSAPHHFAKRQMIRMTWGNSTWYKQNMDLDIRVVFAVAIPTVNFTEIQKQLYVESEKHQDILQEKFIDSYHNLTYKAVGALRWITKHCSKVPFIMKTDDDIYANMPNILKNVVRHHVVYKVQYSQPKKWLYCRVWRPKKVNRDGKWEVSYDMFDKEVYPSYCQGAFYIMTFDVARALFMASYNVPFLWVDDAYLTGVVRSSVGIFLNTCPKNIRTYRLLTQRSLNNHIKYIESGTWRSGCIIGFREAIFSRLWKSTTKLLIAAEMKDKVLVIHSVYISASVANRTKEVFVPKNITIPSIKQLKKNSTLVVNTTSSVIAKRRRSVASKSAMKVVAEKEVSLKNDSKVIRNNIYVPVKSGGKPVQGRSKGPPAAVPAKSQESKVRPLINAKS